MKNTQGRTGPELGVVAAALLAVAAPAAAQNRIVNPGFDSDLSGWTVIPSPEYTVTHDPVMGAGAPGSARVDVDSAGPLNHLVLQQCVTVVAGSNYDFGVQFRFASGANPVPTGAVMVQWFTDGICNAPDGAAFSTFSTNTPDIWQLISATNVPAPPGIGSAFVSMLITSVGAGTSVAWYDDAYFGPNPIPVELLGFSVE
jgi:hypothetical protein